MKKQLMTHVYYGDPSEEFSRKLVETLANSGADILEIGIPYSDPVCDGEVFQRACKRALTAGMTPPQVFEGIQTLRQRGIGQPIYVTSYFGPIFKMGVEKFMKQVAKVKAQGIIVPDIVLEEQKELLYFAKRNGVSIVQFATPYSTDDRLKQIISAASGFIYCFSVPGVTGAREKVEQGTISLIKRVKNFVNKSGKGVPVFVGFGVSKPEHVQIVIDAGADGVIVGSAIARLYESYGNHPETSFAQVSPFVQSLKHATLEKGIL